MSAREKIEAAIKALEYASAPEIKILVHAAEALLKQHSAILAMGDGGRLRCRCGAWPCPVLEAVAGQKEGNR